MHGTKHACCQCQAQSYGVIAAAAAAAASVVVCRGGGCGCACFRLKNQSVSRSPREGSGRKEGLSRRPKCANRKSPARPEWHRVGWKSDVVCGPTRALADIGTILGCREWTASGLPPAKCQWHTHTPGPSAPPPWSRWPCPAYPGTAYRRPENSGRNDPLR